MLASPRSTPDATTFTAPGSRLAPSVTAPAPERRALTWMERPWTAAAMWSVPAALTVLQMYASALVNGTRTPTLRAIVPAILEWMVWAPLMPVILRVARRYPVNDLRRAPGNVLVHLAAIVACTLLRAAVYAASSMIITRASVPGSLSTYLWRISLGWLPIAAVVYLAIVAAGTAFHYAAALRERELSAARLGEQLARAELGALRARLHPHFLFNALHSVGALVRARENDTAVRVVADLSDLLRDVIRRDAPELVPLRDEIAFVRRYLAIEEIRFSDRLRVDWRIEPEAHHALVPSLALQSLVENAIRHGVAAALSAGQVVIAARRERDLLIVEVTDDGPGLSAQTGGGGFGLAALRERLQQSFGERSSVSLGSGPAGGAHASLVVPWREVASA